MAITRWSHNLPEQSANVNDMSSHSRKQHNKSTFHLSGFNECQDNHHWRFSGNGMILAFLTTSRKNANGFTELPQWRDFGIRFTESEKQCKMHANESFLRSVLSECARQLKYFRSCLSRLQIETELKNRKWLSEMAWVQWIGLAHQWAFKNDFNVWESSENLAWTCRKFKANSETGQWSTMKLRFLQICHRSFRSDILEIDLIEEREHRTKKPERNTQWKLTTLPRAWKAIFA
jgi:hypothetical protein